MFVRVTWSLFQRFPIWGIWGVLKSILGGAINDIETFFVVLISQQNKLSKSTFTLLYPFSILVRGVCATGGKGWEMFVYFMVQKEGNLWTW